MKSFKGFTGLLILLMSIVLIIASSVVCCQIKTDSRGFIVPFSEEVNESIKDEAIKTTKYYHMTTLEADTAIQNKFRIDWSSEELEVLERLVEHEAGGESFECKLLTASVIVNRVLDDRFPDNLWDVIFDKEPVLQFTPSTDLYKIPGAETKKAVRNALMRDHANGAWMFNNSSLTSNSKQQWFDEYEIVADIDGVQFRK